MSFRILWPPTTVTGDDNYLGQFGIALNSVDRQYSQEVKWTGKLFNDRLTYTTGLFYLYEENATDFVETLTVPIAPATLFGLELNTPQHFHNTTESEAAYAQGDYALNDQLTFTVGARFTHEVKNYTASEIWRMAVTTLRACWPRATEPISAPIS